MSYLKDIIALRNKVLRDKNLNKDETLLFLSIFNDKITSETQSKDVANYFISKANSIGIKIPNGQLQNMTYLAHFIYLGVYNKPLFKEDIMSWDFGPVVVNLYDYLRKYGSNNVKEIIEEDLGSVVFSREGVQVLEKVWTTFYMDYFIKFGHNAELELRKLITQENSPWDISFNQNKDRYSIISHRSLAKHYSKWIKI